MIFFSFISQSFGSTKYTQCDGDWNDPNIWQGGVVPTTGDYIYVINNVHLTSNLVLNNNYLNISSGHEICGPFALIIGIGSTATINGVAKFSTVTINGSLTVNGNLTTTGNIAVYGSLIVNGMVGAGAWNGVCSPLTNSCYPPVAGFTVSDTLICEGDCLNFFDNSTNYPTSWNWQFNGSTTPFSNLHNPQNICYPVHGVYDVLLVVSNTQGADTIIKQLLITVKSNSFDTIFPVECQTYTSPSGQHTWTTSGVYTDIIPNTEGCDSILTINLTILNSASTFNETTCQSYISPSGNYTWINSGIYFDTIPNSAGCDSIITINLTILNSSSSINVTSCRSYISPSGNYTWTNSGSYIDTVSNTLGCDSIITINLTITDNSSSTINISACNSYTSPSNMFIWTSSGTYLDTIANISGCDSLITLNLVIQSSSYSLITDTACKSYNSPSGNYTWVTSGIYNDTIPNTFSCDSIITIDLTILDCECNLFIPNAFSPNNDEKNDYFIPISNCSFIEYELKIFNRWGEEIFSSYDSNKGWDGIYKSSKSQIDTYIYRIKYKMEDMDDTEIRYGSISLIR